MNEFDMRDYTFTRAGFGLREAWDIHVADNEKFKKVGEVASIRLDCGKAVVKMLTGGRYSKTIAKIGLRDPIGERFVNEEEKNYIFEKAAEAVHEELKRC